jgi:hydrogenase/urease accessory protein HupE
MAKRIVGPLPLAVVMSTLLLHAAPACAHHDPLSSLTVTLEPRVVRLVLVIPADELAAWHPASASDTPQQYAASAARKLQQDAADLFELRLNYNVVSPSNVRASTDNPQVVRLEVEYPPPEGEPLRSLQVFSNLLSKLSPGHQQVTCVQDARSAGGGAATSARVVAWVTLTRDKFTAFVDLPDPGAAATVPSTAPAPAPPGASAAAPVSFFQLGVEHILTGYDHLLFLAALLLVCSTFREAATVITCFTVAHSITLALAALDVVRLPSRVVEPVIAASIVYVSLENLLRFNSAGAAQGQRRLTWRAAVTFAFGLVHGLGFASVLRDLGLGSTPGGVVLPLLKFNLGVETGQLAVASVVFPLILLARSRGPVMQRRLVPACSVLIALAGAWWLFERVALV